jgi:hypothetical protein
MKKSLRRVLDRLRVATNGAFRGSGRPVRGGLQEPQRMQALLEPARIRQQD